MITAWEEAAQDLGLEIITCFKANNREYLVYIKHFGSKEGTVIMDLNDPNELNQGEVPGFFGSKLNPEVYNKYDRDVFIDTLEDWGWFGPIEERPDWYTGKYYEENKNGN